MYARKVSGQFDSETHLQPLKKKNKNYILNFIESHKNGLKSLYATYWKTILTIKQTQTSLA